MKKFYLLTIGALTAMSAMATVKETATIGQIKSKQLNAVEMESPLEVSTRVAAPAKAPALENIAGEYEFTAEGLLQNVEFYALTLQLDVVDAATGEVTIGLFPGKYNVKGYYDATTGTLSLPNNQLVGEDADGPIYFYVKEVIDQEGHIGNGAAAIEATEAVLENGVFAFPTFDIWALGDPSNEGLGWYMLSYANTMEFNDPNADPNEGWTFFSTGVYEDGWIVPALDMLPSEMPWVVNIQKSNDVDGLYRLDCPYTTEDCPFTDPELEFNVAAGYVTFSIADPDYVTVLPNIFSGFYNGPDKMYLFNVEGFYEAAGYTKDIVQESLAGKISEWSSYSDKVVNIVNCRFDFTKPNQTLYVWDSALTDIMKTKITFDITPGGISSVSVDANNAVEYYNLQGVRLDRPTKGVNIRVADGKATKVLSK